MKFAVKVALAVVFVLELVTAAAADQAINWVSVSANGSANGGAGDSAVTDDGRFVAFRSGDPLVPGDSANDDVFVKDMATGAVELVSKSSGGSFGNGDSGGSIDISADGRYVVFESSASNLVAGDSNERQDVFIHDRQTGDTSRALGTDGSAPTGRAIDASISADGRYVAFAGAGYEPGVASNDWGVYVFDRQSGTSERITDGVNFVTTASTYADVDISDDGRHVAFTTGSSALAMM